jgi:hypothetical protein
MKFGPFNIGTNSTVAILMVLALGGCASESRVVDQSSGNQINATGENNPITDKTERKPVQIATKVEADKWFLTVWTPESLEIVKNSTLPKVASGNVILKFTIDASMTDIPCKSYSLLGIEPNENYTLTSSVQENKGSLSEVWLISYCGKTKRTEISIDEDGLKIDGVKANLRINVRH